MTTIALLPWGNVIEDFLDGIGLSFADFSERMSGGWLFGTIQALQLAGIRTVLICVSARVRPGHYVHTPTGAPIHIVRVPAAYRFASARLGNPYGERPCGALGIMHDVAPWLATPALATARVLRAERCGAILCQEYEYARFDVCVGVGRLLGIPVFGTFQGGEPRPGRLGARVRRRTIGACAGLVVGSAIERERVQRAYGLRPPRVAGIPNPLDVSLWYPEPRRDARARTGLDPDERLVIWHGRVDLHRKGLDTLLAAWSRIERMSHDGRERLLLVGTGDDADRLRERIRSHGLRRVSWRAEYVLDRTLMRDLLSAANVSVLPSRHEGFAVAPAEAMACGLPVVACDVPGIRDLLVHDGLEAGIVVPREDAAALADALTSLLRDPERCAAMGRAGREIVERTLSLEAVGTRLRHVLMGGVARDP